MRNALPLHLSMCEVNTEQWAAATTKWVQILTAEINVDFFSVVFLCSCFEWMWNYNTHRKDKLWNGNTAGGRYYYIYIYFMSHFGTHTHTQIYNTIQIVCIWNWKFWLGIWAKSLWCSMEHIEATRMHINKT